MELIRPFSELTKDDAPLAGGKGASLGEMTRAGIPVPPGFVILADAFERFIAETDLVQEIDTILHSVDVKEMHTVEHASEKIQALIHGATMPEDIAREIRESFVALDARYVAVRSSATAEDSASAAWAGQLDSYLNTTKETLLTNVQRCFASLFTPRAIFYRFEKELHKQKISVAAVVQKMVESEVSGIAFSVHPVTEDRNQLIIEAGYGLGEAIVSGAITPDSYVVEKTPRRIIDTNVSTQTRALCRVDTGGNEWKEIPEPKASSQELTERQIIELAELIIQIENHYGFPCDIEWAFEAGTFYIVQSRPITTLRALVPQSARVLTNLFSREKSLYYFDLWNQCDRDGPKKFFGKGLDTVLFIVLPKGKKGSVWYDPHEMEEIKKRAVAALADPEKLSSIRDGLREAWEFLQPYALGKDIESVSELKEYQQYLLQYWSTMNSGVWEALGDPMVSDEARSAFVEVREQTEKYSERWSLLPTEFFAKHCPMYADIAHVVTFDEMVVLAEGTQTAGSLAEIQGRINGCFMLNSVVYSNLAGLDARLAEFHLVRESGAEAGEGEIRGTVAYKGVVRGLVRVVDGKADLGKVQEGDILVTQMTNPTYVPVMKRSGAIVTDEGGALCHAAIASRELQIPCIIGTKVATQVLKDGDLVEVDADNGVVRIIERAVEQGLVPPNIIDYELTFESKGTAFLFEDLVDECYNDAGTFSYAVEGGKKVYSTHTGLAKMRQQGLDMSVTELERAADTLRAHIHTLIETTSEFASKKPFTVDDSQYMLEQMYTFGRLYYLFDLGFWDDVYTLSRTDDEAKKKVAIVEQNKNVIRSDVDDVFFGKTGYFFTMVAQIAQATKTPEDEILYYRCREIPGLFKGVRIPGSEIEARKRAYLHDKQGEESLFLSGEAARKYGDAFLAGNARSSAPNTVTGVVAHGQGRRVTGRACVLIRNYSDNAAALQKSLERVHTGDILVSPTTDPSMLPAMKRAAAIVTDVGGLLSHSSITARELNIPCIIGTKVATQVLKDGDLVEVDADKGVVTVLERA